MGAKALFVDILYCSRFALQSLGLVTQTALKRRIAKSTFKKTLILQGIPPKIANEITKEYPDPVTEFLSLLRNNT
jgi:hypothetical protein